jgi:pimeloyl-ACP methyl ester carboxylesterase
MSQTVNLAYHTADGDGVPLVFLHGWMGDTESWDRFDTVLNVPNPKLFYDQRCHGQSPCNRFDTFEELADDLHALLEQDGIEQPVLVGHSMGGMVALTYATRYDTLSGLVLIGTCASTPEPEIQSPDYFLDTMETMDREQWAEQIVDNYMPRDGNRFLRYEVKDELLDGNEEPLRYGLQAMVSYDVRDRLTQVDVTAQVIGGEQDAAITPEKTRELADLLDCPVDWVDASHLMLYEAPRAVARSLEQFLAANFDQPSITAADCPGGTAELKVPDGKLLRADVTMDETAIAAVTVHGDFFLHPPETVTTIEDALVGAPYDSTVDMLTERITAAMPDSAELAGFEPVHMAQTVLQAMRGGADVQ